MTELENKRKERRKTTGEDFTNPILVNEMLDKIPQEVWDDPTKTFCDPSGGDGAFLIEILKRKLALGHPPLQALASIFSVELMDDNTQEARERMLKELPILTPEETQEAIRIVNHNIVCSDAFKWDFENWKSKERRSKRLFE